MIILTEAEAAEVHGTSDAVDWAALDPVPLKDGTFVLPEEVLDDPAHAGQKAFLEPLPRREVAADEYLDFAHNAPPRSGR